MYTLQLFLELSPSFHFLPESTTKVHKMGEQWALKDVAETGEEDAAREVGGAWPDTQFRNCILRNRIGVVDWMIQILIGDGILRRL
jgi:hypothetical protein